MCLAVPARIVELKGDNAVRKRALQFEIIDFRPDNLYPPEPAIPHNPEYCYITHSIERIIPADGQEAF